jgi:hypothetical protein
MNDLFGFAAPRAPFRDIRKQRDSVAERKAELCLELGALIRTIPPRVRDGSIQLVRRWRLEAEKAAKVAANRRSSVEDLTRAIATMRGMEA